MAKDLPHLLKKLSWLGHDSFRYDGPPVIYLDPWKLPGNSPQADVILISHEHSDHCSPMDVAMIRGKDTIVIADTSAAARLPAPVIALRPGESVRAGGIGIAAVPAYNTDKPFHPQQAQHVGYVLTIADERLYFAGDTDHIPEMSDLDCDVALLPVSGTYVMTAEQAAAAASAISPGVAVPMHYASGVVGTLEDAQRFRELCSVPVILLPREGS